jgi:GTPase involved in cell partitioning and DNA repair
LTLRWGKTKEDDPPYCPYGPEILDLEISSVVVDKPQPNENIIITEGGCTGIGCKNFCYKSNGNGKFTVHMSLEAVKKIINKMYQSE